MNIYFARQNDRQPEDADKELDRKKAEESLSGGEEEPAPDSGEGEDFPHVEIPGMGEADQPPGRYTE